MASISHVVKLNADIIALVRSSSHLLCATLNLSAILSFALSDSHSSNPPTPHLHLTLVNVAIQASIFILTTTSVLSYYLSPLASVLL